MTPSMSLPSFGTTGCNAIRNGRVPRPAKLRTSARNEVVIHLRQARRSFAMTHVHGASLGSFLRRKSGRDYMIGYPESLRGDGQRGIYGR